MNIEDLNWLIVDHNFDNFAYIPYQGFHVVESHIRAAHPEKYTPLSVEDERFPKEFSWMRIHSWAFNYLYFWCIKPDPHRKGFSLQQRVAAITLKPLAAASDALIDTIFIPIKVTIFIDRMIVSTTFFFLRFFVSLKRDPLSMTAGAACFHALEQLIYCISSWVKLFFQPINLIGNLFSPTADLIAGTQMLEYSYQITGPNKEKEVILDQGRVKYLREHCGWEHVTDAMLKSLDRFAYNGFNLCYNSFDKDNNKIYINASWTEYHGNGVIISHWDSNY